MDGVKHETILEEHLVEVVKAAGKRPEISEVFAHSQEI